MIYLYIFLCLIASAFFSGMEIAFLSSDKLRLELDRSRGGVSARILGVFYSRPDHFITTMLLGNNVALVIYGLLTAVLMEPWLKSLLGENDGLILLAQSVLSTLLILFVGEFLPKVTFRANPNRTMRFFAGILFLVYLLLYPFAWIIGLITRAILFLAGQRTSSVAIRPQLSSLDLEYYLTHSSDDGQASGIETEVKIIQNAISFSGLQVRDCLLPRNEIVGASIDSTRAHLEELFIRTGLSKLIVYKENIDEVVGYIHSSEMFRGDDWQKPVKTKGGQLKPRRYSAGVVVTAEARSGLLRDVLDMLAREQCPLLSVQSQTVKELSRFTLVLEVPSAEVLDKLRNAIRQIPGVMGCRRG